MRPIQHLPIKHPSEYDPMFEDPEYFYNNFVKHFVLDMVEMTNNGIPIDKKAVEKLRKTVDKVLTKVEKTIQNNPIIKQYNEFKKPFLKKEQEDKYLNSTRDSNYYLKTYNHTNIIHRTYVVNTYLNDFSKDKWTVADLKKLNIFKKSAFIASVIDKSVSTDNKHIKQGMLALAQEQARLWNIPREKKAYSDVETPSFNVGSAKQLQELFAMLKIEPLSVSKKTGKGTWDRKNIEQLYKVTTDKDLLEVLQCVIDHSFSSIIKNNFINAFDNFTIDGVLYGNINLFGAKSFRNTCLVGDTLVHSSSGLIPIKDLKLNMLVPTVDGSLQKIISIFDNGLAPVFKITLENGQTVTGTSNHKFLTEAGYLSIEDICNVETSKKSTKTRRANPSVMEGKPFVVSGRYGKSTVSKTRTNSQNSFKSCRERSNYRTKKRTLKIENSSATKKADSFNNQRFQISNIIKYRKNCTKTQHKSNSCQSSIKSTFYQSGNIGTKQVVFQQRKQNNKTYLLQSFTRNGKVVPVYKRQKRLLTSKKTSMATKRRKRSVCSSSSNARSYWIDQTTKKFCSSSYKWGQDRQQTGKLINADQRSTFKTASGSSPLKSVEYVGIERVYDVEVETNHCYLANGIWSHNSNSPNLLNMPSSGSIYAKPLKRCFKAPEGYVVYTADLSALEDRVIANLSGDTNKQNIFLENLDGHSLNACGYFKDKIAKEMGSVDSYENFNEYVKEFYKRVENKNEILSGIRFDSKAPTFKLAYGGYPDSHKGGVITQELFDNYHNVLYPGITNYRENYVLPFTKNNGYIHLGLGCRMYCSDPNSDIRTVNNATVQFWSILTLIALNETNYQIKQNNLQNDIKIISTIYDSIYFITKKDPKTIKWLNDNVIKNMCTPYLINEVVHNEAEGEIGNNFADLHKLKNNASVNEIEEILIKI